MFYPKCRGERMANIKKEAQRVLEANILMSIKGKSGKPTAADREAARQIAARSMEEVKIPKRMGAKK